MYNQHPHSSHRQRGPPPPPPQPQYFNQNLNPYYQNPNIPYLQNNLYPIPNTPFIQNPQYPHPHSYNIHPSQQHLVIHSQSLPPPQQQLPQGSQSLPSQQQLPQGSQSKSKPPKQPKPQQQEEPQVSQPKQPKQPKSQQQQQPQASRPQPKQPKPQQQQQPQVSQPQPKQPKQQKEPKSQQQQLSQASQSQQPQPQQHQHTIEAVDAAVTKAHRKLISSGESVTSWKVANSAVQALHSDSWNSLGYKMQQIPSLLRLMRAEGRVNAFIHCFVEVRKITSLYDLELEVCKNEGVKKFDELQLGPWLRHPLALHYFSVPTDTKEVHKITSQDIISYLVEFMDCSKQSDIHAEEFLDFLAMKQEVPAKQKLCIRIQNLRMHIISIKEARKSEDSSLNNCLQILKQPSKKQNKKVEGKKLKHRLLLPQKKVLDKRFNAISQRIKSFSPIQGFSDNHIRFSSSSSEDENDGNLVDSEDDQKDDDTVSSQCKISSQRKKVSDRVSRCPYPAATEEMKRLGLKIEMGGQSSPASSGHRSNETNCLTGKKRKSEDQTVDAHFPPKLPKQDRGKVNVFGVQETGNVQAQSPENKLSHAGWNEMGVLMLTDDTMEKFITTWKEACRLQSVTEVFDRMLQFYKIPDRRRRKLRSMFSSFPCIAILHVAVSSIKYGMWDSPYDTFQAIGERGCNSSVSASAEPEMIDIERSGGRDALSNKGHLSQLECSATLEDIIKKFHTYFELNNTIPREGKPPIEKQIMLLRTLNDCKKWVKRQFSVTKFDSLGFGEFFQFIEEYTSLLPNAMFESLSEDISKKSPLQVFMLQHQLIKLLSQATSGLWENDIIKKQHVELLLKKQFPLISFQVSGNDTLEGGREFVKKHANNDISSSVLFSVSLLRTYYLSHSFVQDEFHSSETQVESDFGQTAGALGSVSAKDAIQCLLKAPMLSDLLSWSHWDLIYAPSLGPLVEWLLSEAPTEELLCLVTKDGKIIRIDHSATVDGFLEALIRRSSYQAAVKLLSLFSLYGGETHVPLSLLKCHSRKGIELILKDSLDHMIGENKIDSDIHGKPFRKPHLLDENNTVDAFLSDCIMHVDKCADQDGIRKAVPVASRFILDCLGNLPPEFRSFAADIFLSGLHSFTKDAPKAILHECKQDNQRLMLHDIGLSLNILEWITDYHAFSCATTNDVFISTENSTIKSTSPTSYLASIVTPDTLENALIANSEATVTAEPEKHNGYSAVHDGLDDVSEKNGGVGSKFLPEDNSSVDASLFIENIRREEFGLDPSITLAESTMLKKQHARLGRALQCLSQELYSQDSHFLLELVQNADDNIYPENVEPTLVFILHSTGIIVLNNERGFNAQNIRALCDVGNSTKKGSRAGYIGQKGIGFKSVFRVTDAPEIHSNGFHVKFDISEGQIGFVLPTVIPPCDIGSFGRLIPAEVSQTDSCWNTCVMLPFKSKLKEGAGMSTIISMFCDLHPSLLLFLHRLRCIKLKNMLNDSSIVMRREIVGDGLIKVSQGHKNMCWFVATEKLQCSVIRPDVQSTEIAVAFTLQESSNGEYRPHLDQQPVFAFLPLRTYGLKFILQGDFVLPSSREEVDGDSAWNQWLLSEFPSLFVRAQRDFSTLHCFQESLGKGVEAYMSFVPLIGEVHGFFAHLPRMIISKLRVSDCLLLEGHKEEWVPPGRVLRGWDEQVRVLLPDSLLRQHLGLGYLDKDIMLSDSLAKALGIHEYGPSVLVDIVSSICRSDDGIRSMGLDWLLSWFNALYMALVHSSGQVHINAGTDANLNESLRKVPFIPLSDGTYSSVAEGTIWLPSDAFSGGFEGEHDTEAFPTLYAKLRTVNPTFLSAAALNLYSMEEESADNVIRMLCKIGVQRLSAHELIKLHILPVLYDDKIPNRETNLMEEYLSFVMLHLQYNCPRCHMERELIMSELKAKAFILTNHGYKRSADVAIHFSKDFGNPVDMAKLVDTVSFKWHEIDSIYLKHSSSKPVSFGLTKWREFFQELGVTDFVRIVQVEKNIADVSQAILKDMLYSGDLIVPGTVAKDWESPELVHLLTTLSSQDSRHKSIYLLEVLDKMWDDCLSAKVKGLCIYKSTEDGKQFKSSFLNSIHDFKWVASSFDQSLHYPKDLYYDCEEVRSFLGNFVPYAVPQIRSEKFVTDMGFKTRVTLDDALEILDLWRSSKTPLTASIGDMSKFYAFIRDEVATAKVKISEVFSSLPSIFVPVTNLSGHEDVVSGKLFPSNEVYWDDPTGSVNLAREILLQSGLLDAVRYPLNMILSHCYQSLHDFFVDDCKVGEAPPARSYIEILLQLSNVSLPSRAAKAVFRILLKWADDLNYGLLEPEDVVYLKECFLKLENTVLPTVRDKWVSLHPSFGLVCWCDDEELRRQFEHSENIDFMYFGELSLHEKEMLPTKISSLMQTLGVPSLSEVITRQAIFYGSENCREKAVMINWILPYAQRYIYNIHPDKYFQLKQSGFEKLRHLQIVAVQKLFYQLAIKGCDSSSKVQHACNSLLQGNILYVNRVSDSHSIFLELSRLFFNGNPELHLANFLHLIMIMADTGSTEEQIEYFIMNSQKVSKLPDEEPVWFLSSLLSLQEESVKCLPDCSSTTRDEQNLLKSRRPGPNNWPPASWKTAPDSSYTPRKWFRTELGGGPSSEVLDKVDKGESFKYTEHHGIPIGIGVDWVTEDDAVDIAGALSLQDFKTMNKQLASVGSSDPLHGRTDCSSEVLNKPAGAIMVPENLENIQFNEKDQLQFGTPNAKKAVVTGRVGEYVAFKYLIEKVGGTNVRWVNEQAETGLPYDIVIGENEDSKEYVEVKSTKSACKDWFSISTREWQFAREKGESFSIAHVVLLGPKNTTITLYKNPLKLCQQGVLQLAVLVPKT